MQHFIWCWTSITCKIVNSTFLFLNKILGTVFEKYILFDFQSWYLTKYIIGKLKSKKLITISFYPDQIFYLNQKYNFKTPDKIFLNNLCNYKNHFWMYLYQLYGLGSGSKKFDSTHLLLTFSCLTK